MPELSRISVTDFKRTLSDAIDRVRFGERFAVTHHSKDRAIMISVEDYLFLSYLEELADKEDLEKARERLAQNNPRRPAREVFAELRAKRESN